MNQPQQQGPESDALAAELTHQAHKAAERAQLRLYHTFNIFVTLIGREMEPPEALNKAIAAETVWSDFHDATALPAPDPATLGEQMRKAADAMIDQFQSRLYAQPEDVARAIVAAVLEDGDNDEREERVIEILKDRARKQISGVKA